MTPKDHPHVGHAFMFVQMDVIRRYLEYSGYSVHHVQNFTDIDDKIIDRATKSGRDPMDWSREHTAAYFDVMDRLRVLRAHQFPRVTDSVPAIIRDVQTLIDTSHAYVTSTGVYFDASSFPAYGQLSGRSSDDGLAGARVAVDEEKKGVRDWALWKVDTTGPIGWESPWGWGRPGWHIECSTIIQETLGSHIDIHGGGIDLVFPHHENEIAQAEASTRESPFVSCWMHTGLLLTDGEKMAHSLSNFTTIAGVLSTITPDVLRLYLLSVHYRSPLHFSSQALQQTQAGYERLLGVLRKCGQDDSTSDNELRELAQTTRDAFESAMNDDFNAPRAVGSIYEFGRALNRLAPTSSVTSVAEAKQVFVELLEVLGIALHEPGIHSTDIDPYINMLVGVRQQLREANRWDLADQIRDDLADLGVIIEDTADGTDWRLA
jgi:cysteinyl-tRNA synthetase